MTPILAEFTGTGLLILLGNGVNANVILAKSKGNNSGWIVIAFGWAIAVFVGVYVSAAMGGDAHLNPAVTIGDAVKSNDWSKVPDYIAAQMLGAMAGASLAWLSYRKHFNETTDVDGQLAVFCNAPAIKSTIDNLITEIIGTFVLVFAIFFITGADVKLHSLDALPVALLILGIGLSLGGPTGYAINPARDLGPRIMHFILPIKNKRDSDWGYSWIPVAGPIIGAVIAALVFNAVQ